MSAFTHIPLGQRIPASVHGVSCSLPTMRDVIGYETKDPETLRHLTSGYPRFVQHPYLRQTAIHALNALGLAGYSAWLTSSRGAAEALRSHLAPAAAQTIEHAGVTGVAFPENAETYSKAKTFLQHTGTLLSSREAEDYLVRARLLPAPQEEPGFNGYAPGRVKGAIAQSFGDCTVSDVFVTSSGMNAVYSAFRIASELQAPRGRTVWVQLGWLYLDTIAILRKFTADPSRDYVFLSDVLDLAGLEQLFAQRGHQIAGVISETPTNPLIQTPDVPAIGQLCRQHGAIFIVDPTVASPLSIDVLPHCDVAVNSLTKYAANGGDIIMGCVAVNPSSPYAATFRERLPGALQPVYSRDISRLACEIADYPSVIARINETTPAIVDFLQSHPGVASVHWANQPACEANFRKIARTPAATAGMVSFTVKKPLASFYDKLRMPKGPSFGMKTSLACPFIYLAHYDLVTSESGRAILSSCGLSPELIRLAIGCEPADEIISVLKEALD